MAYYKYEIGLKIISTPSVAKCISITRKYNPVSMAEIKSNIESNNYVLSCSALDHPDVRKLRRCYDELTKVGAKVEIWECGELSSREIISNLINSHVQTEREVQAQVDAEVGDSGEE